MTIFFRSIDFEKREASVHVLVLVLVGERDGIAVLHRVRDGKEDGAAGRAGDFSRNGK